MPAFRRLIEPRFQPTGSGSGSTTYYTSELDLATTIENQTVPPATLAKTLKLAIGEKTNLATRVGWSNSTNGQFASGLSTGTASQMSHTADIPKKWRQFSANRAIAIDWRVQIGRPTDPATPNSDIEYFDVKGVVKRRITLLGGAIPKDVVIQNFVRHRVTARDDIWYFKDVVPPQLSISKIEYIIEAELWSNAGKAGGVRSSFITIDNADIWLSDDVESESAKAELVDVRLTDTVLLADPLHPGDGIVKAHLLSMPGITAPNVEQRRFKYHSRNEGHVDMSLDYGIVYDLNDDSAHHIGVSPNPLTGGTTPPELVLYRYDFNTTGTGTMTFRVRQKDVKSYSDTVKRVKGEFAFTKGDWENINNSAGVTTGYKLPIDWVIKENGKKRAVEGEHSVEFYNLNGYPIGTDIPLLSGVGNFNYSTSTATTISLTRTFGIDEFRYWRLRSETGNHKNDFLIAADSYNGEFLENSNADANKTVQFGVDRWGVFQHQKYVSNVNGNFYWRWRVNFRRESAARKTRCSKVLVISERARNQTYLGNSLALTGIWGVR